VDERDNQAENGEFILRFVFGGLIVKDF